MKYRIYCYMPALFMRDYHCMWETNSRLAAYETADELASSLPLCSGFGVTIVPAGTDFDQGIHYTRTQ